MSLIRNFENVDEHRSRGGRSHSAQGLATTISSPAMKIPLPPRMWITDIEDESSDEVTGSGKDEGVVMERQRVRSRFRHHKSRSVTMPIGIFWDIENCQVPRGCSAIDVVAAIRAKFLQGRREADFVVVCDVRKEAANRLQELNDAQVSLIHVCGTQKNAADEKLRQCMRRFGELHSAPAALLLISGDINFAADLSDFRHRKNMEVILVHKQNTSSALIACASSHYCYNQLTAALPRKPKSLSQSNEEDVEPVCEMEVCNLPLDQAPEKISKRLRRLADNCGGRVLKIQNTTATLRFPTPDHASRALKRMDGEDVFGRKISTRYARSSMQPAYSSDEGYSTAPAHQATPPINNYMPTHQVRDFNVEASQGAAQEWALALQQLPAPTPPPLDFCPPPAPKPRKIRGTHGSVNLDRSGCSSSNSGDDSRLRAASPWNSSFSEHSDGDEATAELTVGNLPPLEPAVLQETLMQVFSQYVPVVRTSVWMGTDGPVGSVVLRSEWDARLVIAKMHKRRLDHHWHGRRLELSLGRPSPAPSLDVLRARLRAILLDQKDFKLPLLRLRDAYLSRHGCALTTSELGKVRDTVMIHDGFGRMVQLINLNPVSCAEMEEAPWKCQIHTTFGLGQEDGSRILQPVYIEVEALARNVKVMLDSHGGILPLLSFVECYEATFCKLLPDPHHGVALELLLRSAAGLEVRDAPSRHLTWRTDLMENSPNNYSFSESSRSSGERERPRTAPALEPMLALFERELLELLKSSPRCSISFNKLIPAFHHHFGRQCRVADYGFTKLPDLLAALSNSVVVIGSGSSRVITLSAAQQSRRWTLDLLKIVKCQPGRYVLPRDIPRLYHAMFGRVFCAADYGLCTLQELLQRVAPNALIVRPDGALVLPRRKPTAAELARIAVFAVQTVELLCHTPNLRMEFARFVPDYHTQFEQQLCLTDYGCDRLVDLFDYISSAVVVIIDAAGEREIRLTARTARPIVAGRLQALGGASIETLPMLYAKQYGAPPQPDMLEVQSLEQLVYACGGCIEEGVLVCAGAAWRWSGACLAACASLAADRSVARGSTIDYFAATYRRLTGASPDVSGLGLAGVLRVEDGRVILTDEWRALWRLALILTDAPAPRTPDELYREYAQRYEPLLPGVASTAEGLRQYLHAYPEMFMEVTGYKWTVRAGVSVPHARLSATQHEDYSLYDTPPGQKGSRVFESPKRNVWCSPPASALPAPSALLFQEKRRTRLAAQFDAS